MFRSFFMNKKWWRWSLLGSVAILMVTWYKVQLDVKINEWFGSFYDLLQKALATPNSVTFEEWLKGCLTFMEIAALYIVIAVILEFFVRHYVFRWRTAMNAYYISHWQDLRHIEGAAQRVQEDTMRFARIVEGLGVSFMRSIMVLVAFLPILWTLSENITELPWFGQIIILWSTWRLSRQPPVPCCSLLSASSCRALSTRIKKSKRPIARNSCSARIMKTGQTHRPAPNYLPMCARTISIFTATIFISILPSGRIFNSP